MMDLFRIEVLEIQYASSSVPHADAWLYMRGENHEVRRCMDWDAPWNIRV